MQTAGIARGGMSVCPSVTLRYCIKTKIASVMISSPAESLNILVSRNIWVSRNSMGVTPSEGDYWDWGGYKLAFLAIFRPINHHISETVQDRTKVAINHNMKSYTRFRLEPKSANLDDPELTLNGYYALCCITHVSFGAHHKNLNEDRPILSATKM